MADISITVGSQFGSTIKADINSKGTLLTVDVETYISADNLYDKSRLSIHGTLADLQLFVSRLAGAVGIQTVEEKEPEPPCECVPTDVDQVDASGCAVHCRGGELDQTLREAHERNAAVAEPLRSVLNAVSPHVGGEDAPF